MNDTAELEAIRADLRELLRTLRDVSAGGRRLARDRAMSIMEIAALQRNAGDDRPADALKRLETLEKRAA